MADGVTIRQGDRSLRIMPALAQRHCAHVQIVWSQTSPTARAGIVLTREQCREAAVALMEMAMGHERIET